MAHGDGVGVARVCQASVGLEAAVVGNEGRETPLHLDAAALGRPLAAVPHTDVELHGTRRGVGEIGHYALQVAVHADGRAVDVEHHEILVPLHVVVVVVQGGVEPQKDLHLPPTDAVHEDVGVQDVGLSGLVAQKLEVELAMLRPRGR